MQADNSGSTLADVASFLALQVGESVSLEQARPLAGGASMETWALDATWGGVRHELVLRRDMRTTMYAGALNRAEEFGVLGVAYEHGVRTPKPLFLNATSTRPYFLMERLPGISVGPKVVRDPQLADGRVRLVEEMGVELAKIHRIDPESVPFLPNPQDTNPAADALRVLEETALRLDPANPVWAFGLRWLERHLPPPASPVVLHGDFRIGNILVTPTGLSGVIDWEFAHVGDPAEDLAWPLVRDWRFGQDHLQVGGVGTLERYLAAYEAAGGTPAGRERLHWWEVAGNLRWAVFALSQARRHLSGEDPSVEFAVLGRKSAEMEWEMLRLIAEDGR